MNKKLLVIISLVLASFFSAASAADLPNFSQAKKILRDKVFFDQNHQGTFYCGCDWRWMGASGGRVDLASCGYSVRTNAARAERIEWEHIVPASLFGQARQCWQAGGRDNCTKTDPVFAVMEGDLHNLVPSIGEINGDRGNFAFAQFNASASRYGQCDMAIDFKARRASPPPAARGHIARTYFYMHDRYDLPMSRQQQQLLMAWHKAHPVTQRESLLNERIAKHIGHRNEFISGARVWTLNHKNAGEGVRSVWPPQAKADRAAVKEPLTKSRQSPTNAAATVIRGNAKSRVYHLPEGCPHYTRLAPANVVEFVSEADARRAGFTKAGNCR